MVHTGPRGAKYGNKWWPRSPEGGWLASRSRGNRSGCCTVEEVQWRGPTRHRDQGNAGGWETDRLGLRADASE
jgi:hypothetical protein